MRGARRAEARPSGYTRSATAWSSASLSRWKNLTGLTKSGHEREVPPSAENEIPSHPAVPTLTT
jgi:hypothetical protein